MGRHLSIDERGEQVESYLRQVERAKRSGVRPPILSRAARAMGTTSCDLKKSLKIFKVEIVDSQNRNAKTSSMEMPV